jgi:hypothetical protein
MGYSMYCVECGILMHTMEPESPLLCFWCVGPMCATCHTNLHGACCVCVDKIKRIIRAPKGGRPRKLKMCKCGNLLDFTTRRRHERKGCG